MTGFYCDVCGGVSFRAPVYEDENGELRHKCPHCMNHNLEEFEGCLKCGDTIGSKHNRLCPRCKRKHAAELRGFIEKFGEEYDLVDADDKYDLFIELLESL